MKHGSLFAGIGGFDLGFERVGMKSVWQVENDDFCTELLEQKWTDVQQWKDVRNVRGSDLSPVDVISGGFPCQDLSVAGKRAGLDGDRSGLWFEFYRIIKEARPAWVVVENVPGLLSSGDPKWSDLAVILRGLAELGYMGAYRVLDAQYFGVAQRRRRVFIVGHLGDGRAIEVLFERESLPGDPPARKEAGKGVAGTLDAKSASSNRGSQANETDFIVASESGKGFWKEQPFARLRESSAGKAQNLIARRPFIYQHASGGGDDPKDTAQALRAGAEHSYQIVHDARGHGDGKTVNTLTGDHMNRVTDYTPIVTGAMRKKWAKGTGGPAGDEAYNLVAAPLRSRSGPNSSMPGRGGEDDQNLVCGIIGGGAYGTGRRSEDDPNLVGGVRRLTPVECERLQGFPDGWTEGFSDTRRYKMLGNAVCVPVAEWIGRRILKVSSENV